MKKNIALTLLVIYLNAAAQPLLPWVTDMLAHTFNWEDHLELVHHGHVHSQHVGLAVASEEEKQANHPGTSHDIRFHKEALSAHLASAPAALGNITRPLPVSPFSGCYFFYKNIVRDVLSPPPIKPLTVTSLRG